MIEHSPLLQKEWILNALKEGEVTMEGQFVYSSNYTFLVQIQYESRQIPVVYKPMRGERPLWDFPSRSLAKREAAAFIVSDALGWDLVPPTIYRSKLPLGAGSLQAYIEHDPNYVYFNFDEQDLQRLRPAALFDLLINNADRKGGHILRDAHNHLWLIDHGICFHKEDKLRTIIWDFAGEIIPSELLADLGRFADELEREGDLFLRLKPLLRLDELRAMTRRAYLLLRKTYFPYPDKNQRQVPWPLV
jgi:uncharacterized repeat protein (TIGR03843 family)